MAGDAKALRQLTCPIGLIQIFTIRASSHCGDEAHKRGLLIVTSPVSLRTFFPPCAVTREASSSCLVYSHPRDPAGEENCRRQRSPQDELPPTFSYYASRSHVVQQTFIFLLTTREKLLYSMRRPSRWLLSLRCPFSYQGVEMQKVWLFPLLLSLLAAKQGRGALVGLLLLSWFLLPAALFGEDAKKEAGDRVKPQTDFVLTIHDHRLSLNAKEASLQAILDEIGRQMHIEVVAAY